MRFLLFLFPILLLVSCHKEKPKLPAAKKTETHTRKVFSPHNIKALLGEWQFVKNSDSRPFSNRFNLAFRNDTLCEFSGGFYKEIESPDFESDSQLYLGTKTSYAIKGDSLKIYNPGDISWFGYKIISLSEDYLELGGREKSVLSFKKSTRKIVDPNDYDAIIVSKSGCLGSCPVNNTYIDREGNFVFQSIAHNTINRIYHGKIDKEKFIRYQDKFRTFDIMNIDKQIEQYHFTDGPTTELSFIKNGKIYKTISDYSFGSAPEIVEAYTSISYLYQKTHLEYNYDNPLDEDLSYLSFEKKGKTLYLAEPEGFYLMVGLMKSKKVNRPFKPTYLLKFVNMHGDDEWNIKKIETDGRYYRIVDKDSVKVLDLGYNFITRNALETRKRDL